MHDHTFIRRSAVATVLGLLLVALCFALPSGGSAAVTCDLVASPTGSDKASGTATSPLRTAQALVDKLKSGQTGCLKGRDGIFNENRWITITTPHITLTSYPGTKATLKGRLWVDADGVTVTALRLDGRNGEIGPRSPVITAADVTFSGNNVFNGHKATSCFGLGSDYGRAVRTVIENNKIHKCGRLSATGYDHGIYIESSTDAVIRNNYIYDNSDHAIQLYPDAQGTKITGNVIDGNGEGITIGGKGSVASNNNTVTGNIIANSKLGWNVDSGNDGPNATGNIVAYNCIWASSSSSYFNQNYGVQPGSRNFQAFSNTFQQPLYVNGTAGNLKLTSTSGCQGVLKG